MLNIEYKISPILNHTTIYSMFIKRSIYRHMLLVMLCDLEVVVDEYS